MSDRRNGGGHDSTPYRDRDERFHDPGDEELYNESFYLNFYDPGGWGGVLRLGFRPNLGYSEASLYLFHPPGEILFDYRRDSCERLEERSCSGLSMRCEEPFRRWAVAYQGSVVTLTDPARMATEPGTVLKEDPRSTCRVELSFRARYPIHVSTPGGDMSSGVSEFAKDHYEQFGFVEGFLEWDGERVPIREAAAFRDHSWGPRDWLSWERFDQVMLSCEDGTCLSAGLVVNHRGDRAHNGVLWTQPGDAHGVTEFDLMTDYAGDLRNREEFTLRVRAGGDRELMGRGRPVLDLPLTNRPEGDDGEDHGGFNRLSSVLTQFTFEETTGWGITDMMRHRPEGD